MADSFDLNSTQTAFAVVLPEQLAVSIQNIRSVHDKAYLKWPPHFNILYPSISSTKLSDATRLLRAALAQDPFGPLNLSADRAGSFKHRKNATVFLKLDADSEDLVKRLRGRLCNAIGRSESEGTVDGEFKPHMTIGQAVLQGAALEKLLQKATDCLGADLRWNCPAIAILRRNASGNMDIVDWLSLGHKTGTEGERAGLTNVKPVKSSGFAGWNACSEFDGDSERQHSLSDVEEPDTTCSKQELFVTSLNIMSDDSAPNFKQRLPLIERELETVLSAAGPGLKVLCLQEVDQDMLPLLLRSSIIQRHYPFRSHLSTTRLPSIRNKVVMASSPFRVFSLQFAERHKSALFARFPQTGYTIVNVHLTSALTDKSVAIKKRQMDIITEFLMQNNIQKDSILAGDFNITTSSSTIKTATEKGLISRETAQMLPRIIRWKDAFLEYHDASKTLINRDLFPGEEGATFDRLNNSLAAESPSPVDDRPQRFDRILFHSGSSIQVSIFGIFAKSAPGEEDLRISDHYGVFAALSPSKPKPDGSQGRLLTIGDEFNNVDIIQDAFDVELLIEDLIPTAADRSRREDALSMLRAAFSSDDSPGEVVFVPLGSYAMDTHFTDSDIDVLAIGSVNAASFFEKATALLSHDNTGTPHVILINSLVRVLETVVNGVNIDIQYCQSPEVAERLVSDPTVNVDDLIFDNALISTLRPVSLRPLNTLRDTIYLRNTLSHLPAFKTAHRFLSTFLRRHGMYSAKFGYLGGIHLTLMLNRLMKLMEQRPANPELGSDSRSQSLFNPATVIRTFFHHYAAFPWSTSTVEDPCFRYAYGSVHPKRTREPVVIRALYLPSARANVAESCTRLTAKTLETFFREAARKLLTSSSNPQAGWNWCLRKVDGSVSDFLNLNLGMEPRVDQSHQGCFLRIRAETWNLDQQSAENVREFIGGVESKIPGLMVGLGKAASVGSGPSMTARVWPGRFFVSHVSIGAQVKDSSRPSLIGYYLVGITNLSKEETLGADSSKRGGWSRWAEDVSTVDDYDEVDSSQKDSNREEQLPNGVFSKVQAAARSYERLIASLPAVKQNNAWVNVDVVERKKIWDMGLTLDHRDWGAYATGLGQAHRLVDALVENAQGESSAAGFSGRTEGMVAVKSPLPMLQSKRRLRPVQDVLSRLRWDDKYDSKEYVIGYEDRFDGVKEISVAGWTSEATDEEFIPLHRIVWIRKRREGGEKIWDRRMRFDAVFGSGSGAGEAGSSMIFQFTMLVTWSRQLLVNKGMAI